MIDLSKYEKIGECRAGRMVWLSQMNTNIVYLMVFDKDYYVGSSTNLRRRFNQCVSALRHGCYLEKVQAAYNTNHSFDMYCLETSIDEDLRNREEYWIVTLKPSLNTHVSYTTKNMDVRFNIKKKIKEFGFTTQQQIAEKLGISQQAVNQALNGNPTLRRLEQIADALGIPLSELVADEPHLEREPQMRCPHCGHELTVKVE